MELFGVFMSFGSIVIIAVFLVIVFLLIFLLLVELIDD